MIKEREPILERISVLFQVFVTIASYYFAIWISLFFEIPLPENPGEYHAVALVIAPVWFVLLELFDLGALTRIQRYRNLAMKYFWVATIGIVLVFALTYILHFDTISRKILISFTLINFLALFWQKVLGRTIMKKFRKQGYNTRMTIIIADKSSISFIERLIYADYWGYKIGGIITNSQVIKQKFNDKYSIVSENGDFTKVIDERVIDEVFFCKSNFNAKELNYYISKCREVGVIFHVHSDIFSFKGLNPKLTFLNHQFFLSFQNTPENFLALMVKRGLDYLIAITALFITSPIMAVISLIIKFNDPGPVFFKQIRVGKNGRHFTCLKFRTMVVNAEELREGLNSRNEMDGPIFKIKNDPRITNVGKFLRKTSLDEFPQFLNVLMGDMSVVGPRPPIPSEVKQYKRELNRRLSINPGITCIWQTSGRNNIPFDKWMEMDMQYIDNWSLKLDFIIILKTFKVLFEGNGQ